MPAKIKTVSLGDKSYPRLLRETKNAPSNLFYRGILPSDGEVMVAIVGTRKATEEGRMLAGEIAEGLAREGITVVSGLALGIDGAAQASVVRRKGRTVAVLANGLNSVYPRAHERLLAGILENGGCVISEYPPDDPPYPVRFLERNRIVSGLSLATIVIEAPKRSGALVTARLAAEEGREVFVMPGPARSLNYIGSHLLLRNGARLVSDIEQILEDLKETARNFGYLLLENRQRQMLFDGDELLLVSSLRDSADALTIDKLSEITHLETHIISRKLTFLILSGVVDEREGRFKLVNTL